jgi:cytochrome oxidase Cu insertion factor (SCO1/SenC/PrrC family)
MTSSGRRSLAPFWVLLAVTALPFIAAWIVYFNPSLLGDFRTTNRGQLVTPSRTVPHLTLETLEGTGFDTGALEGHWTLLTVADSQCDEVCETNLYHMRQVRLAMGEERARVLRILVLNDTAAAATLADRLAPYTGTVVVTGPAAAREQILALLDTGEGVPPTDRIFIIDPLGNLMMAYPPAPPARDVLKDLERLLQVLQL